MKTKSPKDSKFDFKTIKSFEDACKKENIDPAILPDVTLIPEEFRRSIINMYKLYVIYKAINNGWIADYGNGNQGKYYPWFRVLPSGSGFDFSGTYYDYDRSSTAVGSRLCTHSSEVALYIANTFSGEYKEIFLITK
jgi:hypothetical protein